MAVKSWAIPPLRRWCSTLAKPAVFSWSGESFRRRQQAQRVGQVAVGGSVRQEPADDRDDTAEIEAVSPTEHPAGRLGHLEESDPAAGPHDVRASSAKKASKIGHVAQSETADGPLDGAVGQRETQHVGAHQGSRRVGVAQHSSREIDDLRRGGPPARVHRRSRRSRTPGRPPGRSAGRSSISHAAATPAAVEAEGQHAGSTGRSGAPSGRTCAPRRAPGRRRRDPRIRRARRPGGSLPVPGSRPAPG